MREVILEDGKTVDIALQDAIKVLNELKQQVVILYSHRYSNSVFQIGRKPGWHEQVI